MARQEFAARILGWSSETQREDVVAVVEVSPCWS
jgi:hypothetical protein